MLELWADVNNNYYGHIFWSSDPYSLIEKNYSIHVTAIRLLFTKTTMQGLSIQKHNLACYK